MKRNYCIWMIMAVILLASSGYSAVGLVGQKQYVDPKTGEIHEGVLFASPDGWTVNNVVTVDYIADRHDIAASMAQSGIEPYVKAYEKVKKAKRFQVIEHCDKIGRNQFLVFTIGLSGDIFTNWDEQSAFVITGTRDGEICTLVSQYIIFTKNNYVNMFYTSKTRITLSANGGWDSTGSGIKAVAYFGEEIPDNISVSVKNVVGVRNRLSARQ
ncbi:MAG: hypothetical protein V1838_03085 [Patescibacteria group bacterium]